MGEEKRVPKAKLRKTSDEKANDRAMTLPPDPTVSLRLRLFGPFAVILAIPATSAVATLIDVLVLDHEPPRTPKRSVLPSPHPER